MKKIIILIVGYFCLGVTVALMQSCLSYEDWITDIVFRGNYHSVNSEVDDLTKGIGFQVIAGNSSVSHRFSSLTDIDLFSKCYATTKCAKWQNSLDISYFSMKFDREFVFNSDTIESGKDIFKIESIRENIQIDIDDEDCKFITHTMNFSTELISELTFESGEYIVSFSCKTTDGKEFNKSRRVIFCRD